MLLRLNLTTVVSVSQSQLHNITPFLESVFSRALMSEVSKSASLHVYFLLLPCRHPFAYILVGI